MKTSISCCPLTSKSINKVKSRPVLDWFCLQTVLNLCIFLSWFKWNVFFTGENNITVQWIFILAKRDGLKSPWCMTYVVIYYKLAAFRFSRWTGIMWITCGLWNSTPILIAHIPCRGRWRNTLLYILDGLSKFSANFHFWVNYSFFQGLQHIQNRLTIYTIACAV